MTWQGLANHACCVGSLRHMTQLTQDRRVSHRRAANDMAGFFCFFSFIETQGTETVSIANRSRHFQQIDQAVRV